MIRQHHIPVAIGLNRTEHTLHLTAMLIASEGRRSKL